jgi:uncharacterized protein with FMN-binding domain
MALWITLGVLAVVIGAFVWFLMFGQGVKNAIIKPVDISKIPDGIYSGKYTGGRFGNQMEATIKDGKITDIRIVKDMVVSVPDASNKLFTEVEEKQSLQVDTVSGATVSCKAYLMALEDALGNK